MELELRPEPTYSAISDLVGIHTPSCFWMCSMSLIKYASRPGLEMMRGCRATWRRVSKRSLRPWRAGKEAEKGEGMYADERR